MGKTDLSCINNSEMGICKYCNKEIQARKNSVFCSHSCYSRIGSKNPNWKGDSMIKRCPFCNREFRAKRITQKFCCKECWKDCLSEEFKKSRAAKLNSFITNPSKPQIKLFEKVRNVFSDSVLNYPVDRFSIDIAIPKKMIAIEYDSSYWHNKKYDIKRQKYLERKGWKFVRYKDYVPTFLELKRDLDGCK
jgi:very-short-patch-repair endonuclease